MAGPNLLRLVERMQAMLLVQFRGQAELPWQAAAELGHDLATDDEVLGQYQSMLDQAAAKARRDRLDRAMTATEWRLMTTPIGQLGEQEVIDVSWADEALMTLAWAAGLVESLPPWDTQADSRELGADLLKEPARAAARRLRPRPRPEISAARNLAELWLWRARTTYLMQHPELDIGEPEMSLEEIVVVTAGLGAEDGLFVPIDNDFPAFGKAYRDLTQDELNQATSIATERLRALNWLCGGHRDWDKVQLDT